MAEFVGSAIVQESVNKILSGLLKNYEEKQNSIAFTNLERLEMAHIRLEAVLQTSDKWEITDTSLLRWRRKLMFAAQECHEMLRRCRQRILEDEHKEKDCRMPFDPLIRHLLAGKMLKHRIIRENECPLFVLLAPFITAEHGIEGRLYFVQKDRNVPDDDFCLGVKLQLSESTDIVGVAIQCLQLFAPLFKSSVENIRKKLMQLPSEDVSWVPYVDSHQNKYWDNIHRFCSQWFRPDPLCCKQLDKHNLCNGCKLDKSSGLPHVSLEPVFLVALLCQVSLPESQKQRASLSEYKTSGPDHPCVKAAILFAPHGSSEDMLLANKFPAIGSIYSEEQHFLHTVFTLGQLQEIMLPKAIDYFCQNEEATVYKILWRSRHGTAYIQVERESIFMPSTRQTFHGAKRRKLLQGLDEEMESLTYWVSRYLGSWTSHAPIQPQGSIMDWHQEVKEKHKQHITAA